MVLVEVVFDGCEIVLIYVFCVILEWLGLWVWLDLVEILLLCDV